MITHRQAEAEAARRFDGVPGGKARSMDFMRGAAALRGAARFGRLKYRDEFGRGRRAKRH